MFCGLAGFAQKPHVQWVMTSGSLSSSSGQVKMSGALGNLIVGQMKSKNNVSLNSGIDQAKNYIISKPRQEVKSNINVSVYPNPTNGQVKVQLINVAADESFEIQIFDIMGRQLQVPATSQMIKNQESIGIDFTGLESGHYFIRLVPVNNSYNITTFKLIKQ